MPPPEGGTLGSSEGEGEKGNVAKSLYDGFHRKEWTRQDKRA